MGTEKVKRDRWLLTPKLFSSNLYARYVKLSVELMDEGTHPALVNMPDVFNIDEMEDLMSIQGSAHADISILVKVLIEEVAKEKLVEIRANDELDAFENLRAIQNKVGEVFSLLTSCTEKSHGQMLEDFIEYINRHNTGSIFRIPTPYPTLNKLTKGGLKSGGYSFIGGEPGMGKTSMMIQMGLHAAMQGYKTWFIEGEMPSDEIYERAFGITTGMDIDELYNGNLEQATTFAADMFKVDFRLSIVYERTPRTLSDAVMHAIQQGAKFIVIDYLQVFAEKGADEFAHIKEISESLRSKSLQYPVHLCVGSSLARGENRKGMDRFYGGSQIMHDCTTAILLEGEQGENELVTGKRTVTVKIPKNRGGARGDFTLNYDLRSQKFSELYTF